MGIEIERKFLVATDEWRQGAVGTPYVQGYLSRGIGCTVRIRIAGEKAFLTIKGPVTGISRSEFEYSIPMEDAKEMLSLSKEVGGGLIEKTRYRISHATHLWEVDEFHGANKGLLMAEVELQSPEESVSLPPWLGMEVTGDFHYYNSYLVTNPYTTWMTKKHPHQE